MKKLLEKLSNYDPLCVAAFLLNLLVLIMVILCCWGK